MRRVVQADRVRYLRDDARGLSELEVEARRARHGANDIVETAPSGWRDVLRDTVKDPMLWFLAATSALFAVVGDYGEAAIMVVAIVPIVGMDAFLHRRTQASAQGLRGRLADFATVVRAGAEIEIRATEIVPGDLVRVASGLAFPADGVIVAGDSLQADESALTGEAFPVGKRALAVFPDSSADAAIDSAHWGFAGTRLLTGTAAVRVLSTGSETLYGEIVRSAIRGAHARTPLQHAIASLVAALLAAAGALCFALAWVRWQQGHGLLDALLSAVTLAVAAIPEEFPIVFTFFLGLGIFRLARRQALVRRAVVVENIGRVSCICSDKTGTLTEGRMRVAHEIAAHGDGDELRRIAALASRADSADPLDAALLAHAGAVTSALERVATFPFTEDRRRETSILRAGSGALFNATKGAPETIFALCDLGPAERAEWEARVRELGEAAHKVIACASLDMGTAPWDGIEPERGYRLAGILACEDPVRAGVADSVRWARNAGVHVIMITGDHSVTALAVAREVGIGGLSPRVIQGNELEDGIASNGGADPRGIDVVARAIPAQKLLLVRTLQAQGEIVAVTGDGVNDVPALQAADVGIAMGERGTRSAREVAAIVLLDDNFRTIVNAIAEGRQLFRNLRLSFAYLLMIHIPLVATATLIPLGGYPLLYLPIHVVWLELIIHPTALLVYQELPPDAHPRPLGERERSGRFFGPGEWLVIGAVGAIVTLVIVWSYERSLGAGMDVEHARATALVTLVVAGAAVTASLSALRTRVALVVVSASVLSAALLVQVPVLAALVHLEPLHLDDWSIAVVGGVLPGALASLLRVHWPGRVREAVTT